MMPTLSSLVVQQVVIMLASWKCLARCTYFCFHNKIRSIRRWIISFCFAPLSTLYSVALYNHTTDTDWLFLPQTIMITVIYNHDNRAKYVFTKTTSMLIKQSTSCRQFGQESCISQQETRLGSLDKTLQFLGYHHRGNFWGNLLNKTWRSSKEFSLYHAYIVLRGFLCIFTRCFGNLKQKFCAHLCVANRMQITQFCSEQIWTLGGWATRGGGY